MRVRVIQPLKKIEEKKKVCAYARVSTESDAQGESLENQIITYQNILSSNPEYEFVEVFADRGITGTIEDRPEFQRMLKMCRERKIDLIFTKSISRFARNTTIVLKTIRELKDIGVEVKFEKENIGSISGDGELMLTVLSSFAEEESRGMSENIKWRIKKKFEKGDLILNTKRFLGYDRDEYGDLIINQKEAMVVERIYKEYLDGNGVFKITKMLNEEGVATVTGAKWHESTVLEVLKNEKYKGDVILQKTYTPNHLTKKKKKNKGEVDSFYIKDNHSPIISKEMWEKVQIKINNKGILRGIDKYQNRYPFSGMLICGKCGETLRRRTWNSKLSCKKIVWQCSNYIKNGKHACKGTKIDDSVISNVNIKEPMIVKEEFKNGKKHYSYTCKSEWNKLS